VEKQELSGQYYVNTRIIVADMINTYVGHIIEAKYGNGHARAYRILKDKSQLEEKQIFDYCLLPQDSVRKIIERMYKEGIFQLVELPSRGGGTIRLYSVKDNDVRDKLVRLTQKAVANVMIKKESLDPSDKEFADRKELLKGCVAETAEQLMILSDY